MTNWINTSDGWKQVVNIWINTTSGWKQAISGFANTAAAGWQLFWGGAGQPQISVSGINRVAISISGTTDRTVDWTSSAPVLVGTNYNWTNYSSGTYEFQRAEAGETLTWQTIGTPTNFNVNPTTSAQYTYTLQESDFPYGANTLFRFVVTVTNTAVTPNKTAISYSTYSSSGTLTGYVTVNYPRPKGIPGSPTISRDADTNYTYNITGYGSYYNDVTITSNLVSWQTSNDNAPSSTWTQRNTDNLPYAADLYKGKYLRLGVKGSNSYGQASDFIYSSPTFVYYKAPVINSFTVTGGVNEVTYNYNFSADDTSRTLLISYTGAASGSFEPDLINGTYSLPTAGSYTFTLTITNSTNGNSLSTTATSSATVSNIVYPSAPTINSHSQTSNSITLNFTRGANSTSVHAYINGTQVGGNITATSYTFTGLSASTSYSLALYGYDGTRESQTFAGGNYSTDAAPPVVYTITYYGNTSDGGTVSSGSYTSGGAAYTIAANGFTKTNYTFSSWNTAANGTGTTYLPGASYSTSANLSLYAQWTIAQYTVTWNVSINGGTGGGSTTQNAGVAHTAPSPGTKDGYAFNGYYNTPSGDYTYGPISSGGSFTPPSSITMYARWTLGGPSGATASISGTTQYAQSLVLNTTEPTSGTSPITKSWVWQISSDNSLWSFSQSNGSTYTLGSIDLGKYVRAVVTWANSYGSQIVNTSSVGPVTPVDLTGLSVKSYTSGSLSLTWNSSGGAGSYAVTIGGPNGISTSTTSTSYSISGLVSGTSYFVQVVPYTGTSGNGTAGNGQSVSNKYPNGSDAAAPFFPFFPPFFPFFPPFFPFFPPFFPYFESACPPGYTYGIVCCGGLCSDPGCFPDDFSC